MQPSIQCANNMQPSPSGSISPSSCNDKRPGKAMLDDTENYFDYAVPRALGTRLQYPKEPQLDRWMEILRPFQTHMELDKYRCRKSYQASGKAAVRNIARLLSICVGDSPSSTTLEDVITEKWFGSMAVGSMISIDALMQGKDIKQAGTGSVLPHDGATWICNRNHEEMHSTCHLFPQIYGCGV